MNRTLHRISVLSHVSFITLVLLTTLTGWSVEWTSGAGTNYLLVTLYVILSCVTPAFLIASTLGQLDDVGPRRNATAKKNLLSTIPLFLASVGMLTYWYDRPDLEFFPLVGIVLYVIASGLLSAGQALLLLTPPKTKQLD